MIKEMNGNLLDSKTTFIGHQVNCQGKMGSGVAKCIRDKFPKVYEEYSSYCMKNSIDDLFGDCLAVPVGKNQIVANLFGQKDYGYDGKQYTDYEALESALILLNMNMHEGDSVSFPYKMGCDRGGADWDKVTKMIEDIFEEYPVEIWRL